MYTKLITSASPHLPHYCGYRLLSKLSIIMTAPASPPAPTTAAAAVVAPPAPPAPAAAVVPAAAFVPAAAVVPAAAAFVPAALLASIAPAIASEIPAIPEPVYRVVDWVGANVTQMPHNRLTAAPHGAPNASFARHRDFEILIGMSTAVSSVYTNKKIGTIHSNHLSIFRGPAYITEEQIKAYHANLAEFTLSGDNVQSSSLVAFFNFIPRP